MVKASYCHGRNCGGQHSPEFGFQRSHYRKQRSGSPATPGSAATTGPPASPPPRGPLRCTYRPGGQLDHVAHCDAEQVDQAEREGAGDKQRGGQVASCHLLQRLAQHQAARLQQAQEHHPGRRVAPPWRAGGRGRPCLSEKMEQEKPTGGRHKAAPASGSLQARAPPTPRATVTSQTGRGLLAVTPLLNTEILTPPKGPEGVGFACGTGARARKWSLQTRPRPEDRGPRGPLFPRNTAPGAGTGGPGGGISRPARWRAAEAEAKRSVIAPRAAEVISAYVASAGLAARAPPPLWGTGCCTYPALVSPPGLSVRPALREPCNRSCEKTRFCRLRLEDEAVGLPLPTQLQFVCVVRQVVRIGPRS